MSKYFVCTCVQPRRKLSQKLVGELFSCALPLVKVVTAVYEVLARSSKSFTTLLNHGAFTDQVIFSAVATSLDKAGMRNASYEIPANVNVNVIQ